LLPVPDHPDSDLPGPDSGGDEEQALDAVRAVVSWYNAQLVTERRSSAPDEARMEELKAARQAAIDDQQRLETADPEETARIAVLYAARLRELNDS
jgi:hypothetical protein